MMVRKDCAKCGIDLGEVFHTQKYCKLCADIVIKQQRLESSRRHRTLNPPALKVIKCIDCSIEFVAPNRTMKRCRECRTVIDQRYHAIREIRSQIAIKSIVTPEEARGIVEDMLKEEGQEFTEFMIDGLMSKVLKKE